MRLLGKSLQVAMENALRDIQLADIAETLARLDAVDPATDIAVVDAGGAVRGASQGFEPSLGIDDDELRHVIRTRSNVLRVQLGDQGDGRVFHYLPLLDDDERFLGVLVLTRPLTALTRDLDQTTLGLLLPHLLFVAIALSTGALFGARYVTRPLDVLVTTIRRVRAGDLRNVDVSVTGNEFGLLAKELAVSDRWGAGLRFYTVDMPLTCGAVTGRRSAR